jgi:uncharacterized SAM-binding protein YcdF (DUF218 family)
MFSISEDVQMLISMMDPEKLTIEQITKVVFGNLDEIDDGTLNGDCIFVFGGIYVDRAIKAVELYKKGRAPYVLFTGGDRWGQYNPPESIFLRDEAIKRGVPSESILIEQISNHTKENLLASLMVLDRAIGLEKINQLLVVSSPGHMRRCLLILKTFLPDWYEFIWCPDNRLLGQRDNWWTDSKQKKRVFDELNKIISGVKGKYFIDEEVRIE